MKSLNITMLITAITLSTSAIAANDTVFPSSSEESGIVSGGAQLSRTSGAVTPSPDTFPSASLEDGIHGPQHATPARSAYGSSTARAATQYPSSNGD